MKYIKEFEKETGLDFEFEVYDNGQPYYAPKVKVRRYQEYYEWLESKFIPETMKVSPCTRYDGRQTLCGAYRDGMCYNLVSSTCEDPDRFCH
jgi:hypothetical protein